MVLLTLTAYNWIMVPPGPRTLIGSHMQSNAALMTRSARYCLLVLDMETQLLPGRFVLLVWPFFM